MLVSDSDEVRNQLDSKKLEYDTLIDLARDNLFKKHFDVSKYLTYNQFNEKCKLLSQLKESLDIDVDTIRKPKFRVVNGQVILIDVNALNEYNDGQEQRVSPDKYVRSKWNITSEYRLIPIPDCMLRGMLGSYE